jgi:Cell Wall Hydrolase
MDLSAPDRDLITKTIIGEAGDQPPEGQAAVAHVIKNRLESKSGEFANGSVPQVVLGRNQFESWSADNRVRTAKVSPKSDAYKTAAGIADDVFSGRTPDPTNGATYFYSPKDQAALRRQPPAFAQYPSHGTIGGHEFFSKDGPDLVREWMPGAKAAASPPGAPDEDLVSEWLPAAKPAPRSAPATAASSGAMMPVPKPPDMDTLGQTVARMTGESQGDSYTDMAKRLGLGAVRGVGDVADTLAQGIGYVGEKGAGALQRAGVISPGSAKSVADWHARINADISRENAAFDAAANNGLTSTLGRIGGQIAGTGPLLATGGAALSAAGRGAPIVNALLSRPMLAAAARGAGAGAGANLLTSAASEEPLSEQLQGGAETGAVAGPVGRFVGKFAGKLVGSGVDTETANLAAAARDKFGIPLRADQVSANPMVRFMGSVLQRMPFTGLGEHVAEQQTAANRAIANEMGQVSDKVTPQTIRAAKADLGQRYQAVNRAMGPLQLDRNFVRDIRDARDFAHLNLEPGKARIIEKHIDDIGSKIDPATGTMTPEAYQHLLRHDGPLDLLVNSNDTGGVGKIAQRLKGALESQFERSDPALARIKKDIDYRYWVANAVEPLAHESTTGDISMAKLLRAADMSTSDLGQLGRVGQRFLKEPPSSGTAERLALMKLGLGLGAGAAGLGGARYFDPENWQQDLLLAGTGALGAKGLGSLMKRPELTNMLIRSGQRQQAGRGWPNALQLTVGPAAALLDRQRRNPNALAATP